MDMDMGSLDSRQCNQCYVLHTFRHRHKPFIINAVFTYLHVLFVFSIFFGEKNKLKIKKGTKNFLQQAVFRQQFQIDRCN